MQKHALDNDRGAKIKMQKFKSKVNMLIAAAREGILSRRVSEEGGEKDYRSEKAAVLSLNFNFAF